ncbi:MAG: FadR/GntR family transcriptional regulator [Janthinobacterium lividum]
MAASTELGFERIHRGRVFEDVCQQIRTRLAAGALNPGDKLPAERDLAIELGVSRPVIREALRALEMSGIVRLQKGVKGGAFIREGTPDGLMQSMQDLLVLRHISSLNLAEARSLIFGMVVRLACERGDDADFDAIEDNLRTIDTLTDPDNWIVRAEQTIIFFCLVARATHNEVLVLLVESLSRIIRYVVDRSAPGYRPELAPVRWNILKALRARDAEQAAAETDVYLRHIKHNVLRDDASAPSLAQSSAETDLAVGTREIGKRTVVSSTAATVSTAPATVPANKTAKAARSKKAAS